MNIILYCFSDPPSLTPSILFLTITCGIFCQLDFSFNLIIYANLPLLSPFLGMPVAQSTTRPPLYIFLFFITLFHFSLLPSTISLYPSICCFRLISCYSTILHYTKTPSFSLPFSLLSILPFPFPFSFQTFLLQPIFIY